MRKLFLLLALTLSTLLFAELSTQCQFYQEEYTEVDWELDYLEHSIQQYEEAHGRDAGYYELHGEYMDLMIYQLVLINKWAEAECQAML
ncbi:MAG: hypothetical protein QNK37_31395 [Acidobacteriota bacterium]|nr:hypothetical protein [Acidobacteriota bacterium]